MRARYSAAVFASAFALASLTLISVPAPAATVAFSAPQLINPPSGQGYEPSIKIDSIGTIFITAHKNDLLQEGGQLNSWMWRSTDDGQTFSRMPGGELFWSFEGDWAIDGEDRLYFVDTYAADNHFASWTNHGADLVDYRPYTATLAGVDDRPWLTAHHDGYVYVLVNWGYTPSGRLELHRSTDRGATFDPVGILFPQSGWGTPFADPNSDYVYVAMNDKFWNGAGYPLDISSSTLSVWISSDRASTFHRKTVAPYAGTDPDGYPVVVTDAAGNVFILWSDAPDETSSRLKLSRSTDHGESWTTFDITPPDFRFNDLYWLAADPSIPGLLGVGWNASAAATRGNGMAWDFNAGVIGNALGTAPSLEWTTVDAGVNVGSTPPQDFFQVAFAPDHKLHLTWGTWRPRNPGDDISFDIYYAKQTAGPNL